MLKQYITATNVYQDEDLLARAMRLAWSAHHTGDPTFLRSLDQRIAQQSWDDVRGYSDAYLGHDQAHVVLVRPGAASAMTAALGAPAPTLRWRRSRL